VINKIVFLKHFEKSARKVLEEARPGWVKIINDFKFSKISWNVAKAEASKMIKRRKIVH